MLFQDPDATDTEDARPQDRREKSRFPLRRELKYKVVRDGATLIAGIGQTIDIGSGGVCFEADAGLQQGAHIQLSINWPVLLDDTCPMRLVVFGRVLRSGRNQCACSIDKYEFRTASRLVQPLVPRGDSRLERWADAARREAPKARAATA